MLTHGGGVPVGSEAVRVTSGGREIDGWWWSKRVLTPGRLSVESGVRFPDLGDSLGPILHHLESARASLAKRSVADIIRLVGSVGERFLTDLQVPSAVSVARDSGFSDPMSERVVQGMAETWTRAALESLYSSEFPVPGALDGFVTEDDRRVRAFGRGVTVHIGAGSVPGVAVTSLIRALIVKCPSLVKPGRGDVALTVAFAAALAEKDPELADAVAVLYWPGGSPAAVDSEQRLLSKADQVVVYGSDSTVARIRANTPAGTHLVEHPHRVGIVVADRGADVEEVAHAACTFDQAGCVSAQVVLFAGGGAEAMAWSELLAEELDTVETSLPPGQAPTEGRSDVHQLRGTAELREAAGEDIRVWYRSGCSWTVVVSRLADVTPMGQRTIWVVPCPTAPTLGAAFDALGPVLQSVGLAGGVDSDDVAVQAGTAGASRIVPVAEIPFPRANWLHDGQRPLRELVRWVEWR